MVFAVVTFALLLLIYIPSMWIRWVMNKYGKDSADIPGTGGELAEHLINRFELEGYVVERADKMGDHFDPDAKAVRLTDNNYFGKSLTAVAVAAHEVGHAIQHFRQEKIFELRKKYIPKAIFFQKLGVMSLALFPFIAVIIKAPAVMVATIAVSLAFQLIGALAYLIVLPEEWDASFNKALPILIDGEYIEPKQEEAVRDILKAAALTYFAAALASMLNIGRWLLILRR